MKQIEINIRKLKYFHKQISLENILFIKIIGKYYFLINYIYI